MREFCFLVIAVAASAFVSKASTLSVMGLLNNPNAIFTAQIETLATAPLTIQSWGYGGTAGAPGGTNAAGMVIAPGGFDSYVSLFRGWGAAATFLASADDGNCPPATSAPACLDAYLSLGSLSAGRYTVILSAFENISRAEDFGFGTLGDGFTGTGSFFDSVSGSTRSARYALDISSPAFAPEPSTLALTFISVGAVTFVRKGISRRHL